VFLLNVGCKDDSATLEPEAIDPYTLAEGTIIFDINGETWETTEGVGIREDAGSIAIGSFWVIEGGIRVAQIDLFGIEFQERSYEIFWNDCSNDFTLPCGLIDFYQISIDGDASYRSQSEDTYLKVDIQELGSAKGEKLLGTFEARVKGYDDVERFDVTNGAFHVVIQE